MLLVHRPVDLGIRDLMALVMPASPTLTPPPHTQAGGGMIPSPTPTVREGREGQRKVAVMQGRTFPWPRRPNRRPTPHTPNFCSPPSRPAAKGWLGRLGSPIIPGERQASPRRTPCLYLWQPTYCSSHPSSAKSRASMSARHPPGVQLVWHHLAHIAQLKHL